MCLARGAPQRPSHPHNVSRKTSLGCRYSEGPVRSTYHVPVKSRCSFLLPATSPVMAQNKLLFALVARGTVVLAEHNTTTGNAAVVAIRILERLPAEDTRVTYTQDRHMFHIMLHDGLTFLCMAEESAGRRGAFAFLEDIKGLFLSRYGNSFRQAVAYEYNADFSKVLQQRMDYFSNDPSADVINRVKGEITQVKDIMIENIEKVLDRGEKLDLLVDKTELLQGEAFAFRREAKRARRVMWWKNVRMWFIMGGVVAAIIFIIVMLTVGFNH